MQGPNEGQKVEFDRRPVLILQNGTPLSALKETLDQTTDSINAQIAEVQRKGQEDLKAIWKQIEELLKGGEYIPESSSVAEGRPILSFENGVLFELTPVPARK